MKHNKNQLDLFRDYNPESPIEPCDPNVPEAARARLSSQCHAILERLRSGDATNRELAQIALKYTSRISDLRAAGYRIDVVSQDHESGLAVYRLVPSAAMGAEGERHD